MFRACSGGASPHTSSINVWAGTTWFARTRSLQHGALFRPSQGDRAVPGVDLEGSQDAELHRSTEVGRPVHAQSRSCRLAVKNRAKGALRPSCAIPAPVPRGVVMVSPRLRRTGPNANRRGWECRGQSVSERWSRRSCCPGYGSVSRTAGVPGSTSHRSIELNTGSCDSAQARCRFYGLRAGGKVDGQDPHRQWTHHRCGRNDGGSPPQTCT